MGISVSKPKLRKKKVNIQPMEKRVFLNLDGFGGDAFVSASISNTVDSSYAYNVKIADCRDRINLHGSLGTKEDLKNFKYKMQTLIGVLSDMVGHVDNELKKQPLKNKINIKRG